MALQHLDGLMDPKRRIFMPILERSATLEDTTHLLSYTEESTCVRHLLLSGRVTSLPFSKYWEQTNLVVLKKNFDYGGSIFVVLEEETRRRRRNKFLESGWLKCIKFWRNYRILELAPSLMTRGLTVEEFWIKPFASFLGCDVCCESKNFTPWWRKIEVSK